MTKTIFVLGATGKAGSKISENLLKEGHHVKLNARAEVIPADLTNAATLTNAFNNADFAALYHSI